MKKLKQFVIDIYQEPKIPQRDKITIIILFLAGIIPNIIAPEISGSIYGILYTLVILSFIPDYFFNILDHNLILSHYPFSMKSFNSLKRAGQFLAVLAPNFISNFLWEYQKDVI